MTESDFENNARVRPRRGPAGLIDRYLGPGAGSVDRLRVALAALGGALLGGLTVDATLAPRLVLIALTAEICAGLMAALNHPGKIWIHRPAGRNGRQALFVAAQLIPLAVFIWLFRAADTGLLLTTAGLLAAGSAVVALTPWRWQRAAGLIALLAVMFAVQELHGLTAAAAWFLPLFYARVFLAYLPAPLPDAPQTPQQ